MADKIVDLVSSGMTMKANDLIEIERILDIKAIIWFLINNKIFLKIKTSKDYPNEA